MQRWLKTSRWPRLLGLSFFLAAAGAVLLFTAGHRYRIKNVYTSAEKQWEAGDYLRAIELFQSVIDEDTADPMASEAQFRIGSTYYLFLKRDRDAIQAFRDLIKRDPLSPWSYRAQELLGEIFEKRLEDYRQAIVEYQRLINLAPEAPDVDEAQLAVARCYFKMGDFEQAREEYEIHLERYPESPRRDRALAGVANCHYVTRSFLQAIQYYRLVMDGTDDVRLRAEAGYGIASSLEEAGDLEGAQEEFERIRGDYPNPELLEQRLARIGDRLAKKNQ